MSPTTRKCKVCGQSTINIHICDICVSKLKNVQGAPKPAVAGSSSFIGLIFDWLTNRCLLTVWKTPSGDEYTKDNWKTHPEVAALIPILAPVAPPPGSVTSTDKCTFCGGTENKYPEKAACQSCIKTLIDVDGKDSSTTSGPRLGFWGMINTHWLKSKEAIWTNPDGTKWDLINWFKHPAILNMLRLKSENQSAPPDKTQSVWNCKCRTCGSDAYIGLIQVECSNPNCKGD